METSSKWLQGKLGIGWNQSIQQPMSNPNASTAHLAKYMWQKGMASPNPSGRPKGKVTRAVDKALTKERALKVADALISQAEKGYVPAFEAVRDTVDGPLPKPVQIAGEGGGPLQVEINLLHFGAVVTEEKK